MKTSAIFLNALIGLAAASFASIDSIGGAPEPVAALSRRQTQQQIQDAAQKAVAAADALANSVPLVQKLEQNLNNPQAAQDAAVEMSKELFVAQDRLKEMRDLVPSLPAFAMILDAQKQAK
ncbi:hypothetical protein CDD81_2397 [Ophiocordyceps australis]|uniref:Uncharacterized protein n=1 Tax=Ophiocordyceps australis TaxID=1399860 RepID=A0A2C5X7M3_9HYPO|nr:hypothetical protein CDD81_2397 [Ophiocordyceps australis]